MKTKRTNHKAVNTNHHEYAPQAKSSFAAIIHGFGSLFRGMAWLIVVLLVVAAVGRYIHLQNRPVKDQSMTTPPTTPTPALIDWSLVDADVREAIVRARTVATEHADRQVDNWVDNLRGRIDEHFLDWYFGFWTQKQQGVTALRYWLESTRPFEFFFGEKPEVAERITEDIQTEFAQRVLRPVIAQREIERMTRSTIEVYVTELRDGIAPIQARHNIPQPTWDQYLNDLALITAGSGPDTTPVTIKALTASTVGVSSTALVALYHALRERMAAVGAKAGSKLLGPVVLVGVVIWDVWDHNRSRGINEPILRENLNHYLDLLNQALLDDPEGGILTVVTDIEQNLHHSLQERQ